MADEKYNRKNPAVKRILQEVKEMQSNPSDDFMSLPLEENIFEWHFAIRGPSDTEFEGGIYHGRIQLPADYPFKPPSFMLLSPNGRFETQTKICLSISNHHPEHWQPSWSVRTALVALIAFMPTSPNGALGSLDYTKEERRALAVKSRQTAPKFGSPERQQLIDEIHEYLLSKAPSVSQVSSSQSSAEQTADPHIEGEGSSGNASADATQDGHSDPATADTSIEEQQEASPTANSAPMSPRSDSIPNTPAVQPSEQHQQQHVIHRQLERTVPRNADDRLFNWAAIGLTLAIVVLLLKKYMKANGHGALFTDES